MLQTQPLMGLVSAGCNADIVRSGHIELDTLWASNDTKVISCPDFIIRTHNIVKYFWYLDTYWDLIFYTFVVLN